MATEMEIQLRLDHAAVWVEDMDKKTVAFLTDVVGWKRHPMEVQVSAEDETTGGMEATFIDANGLWLELILPTSPGPGMDILRQQGAGAIVEINFEPGRLRGHARSHAGQRHSDASTWMARLWAPNGGLIKEGVVEEGEMGNIGQRIAYWPLELTRGTSVEIYEAAERGRDQSAQRSEPAVAG